VIALAVDDREFSLYKVITLDLSEREEEEEEQITKRTVAIIIITIIDESHWDKTIKRQREDTFFYSFFSSS
jgi:hypothetical protein